MALVLKTKTTRAADGSQLFIEFYNATGLYNVSTNPGGFGSPNPIRNTLAMIFYGNHKRVAADVLAVPLAYDPVTVESYTLALPGVNGVLDYNIFAIPIFDPMGSYADGAIVWDNQNPTVPFIKKRVSSAWVVKQPADIIGEAIIVQKEGFAYPIPEMEKYRNELNTSRLNLLSEKVESGVDEQVDYDTVRNAFDFVDGLLDASGQDFCSGAYNEAQKKLERIEAYSVLHPVESFTE